MHFSRVRPHPSSGGNAGSLPALDSPYREHQLLWQLFPDDPAAERDFLFRRENTNGIPGFYLVSRRPPKSPDGGWQIESKAYHPTLTTGQQLAFSLRANPVVTRKGADGRSRRHDLVMDLKRQSDWQEQAPSHRPSLAALMQEAAEQWLAPRLACSGAELISVRSEAYQQHRHQKAPKGRPIRFSTLDLVGLLTVMDPVQFSHALTNGVGPAKAFGCGLLLVRNS